jgi:hypothetical protein
VDTLDHPMAIDLPRGQAILELAYRLTLLTGWNVQANRCRVVHLIGQGPAMVQIYCSKTTPCLGSIQESTGQGTKEASLQPMRQPRCDRSASLLPGDCSAGFRFLGKTQPSALLKVTIQVEHMGARTTKSMVAADTDQVGFGRIEDPCHRPIDSLIDLPNGVLKAHHARVVTGALWVRLAPEVMASGVNLPPEEHQQIPPFGRQEPAGDGLLSRYLCQQCCPRPGMPIRSDATLVKVCEV